jgi:hypothetical protein
LVRFIKREAVSKNNNEPASGNRAGGGLVPRETLTTSGALHL